MLVDLPSLRKKLADLRTAEGWGPDQALRTEALVECAFRVAVHPDTEGPEARDLLAECARMDGTHPRYAYHLARVHFSHGDLDQARVWIEQAIRLCPTSHRIWSHVCLLQWELNLRYYGDQRFEADALRSRADDIAGHVRSGEDNPPPELLDFQPPESLAEKEKRERHRRQPEEEGSDIREAEARAGDSPVRRLSHPGRCRWSGIHDLLVERLVEGRPRLTRLGECRPLLETIGDMGSSRPGGVSGFVIAGIQWIINGYPVSTIRRLAKELDGDGPDPPSRQLLDLVCTLWEAPEHEVSTLLANALESRRIPPILAAIVHRRRALWRPLEYPTLVAYRNARRLLADCRRNAPSDKGEAQDREEEIQTLVQKLTSTLKSLDPTPPKPLEEPDVSETAAPPQDDLSSLEDWTDRQSEALDALWKRLKTLAAAAKKGDPDALDFGEIRETQSAAEDVFLGANERLKQAEDLRKSGQVPQDSQELARLDATEKRLQTMLGRKGPFRAKFAAVEKAAPAQPEEEEPPEGKKAEIRIEGSGLDALAQVLTLTDNRITEVFEDALATFDSYSEEVMEEPPLRALRQSVQVRRAETLHRMGRRAEARGVLSRMIRENPVDPEALKRLAICDSGSEDPAQNTKAWQAYAEVLYFLDVVEGSPRPRAQARRELHQALGGAFAPHFLAEKLDPNWQQRVDAQQMMSFLSSPGRVRNFVEHKLLELLNAQLQHRSPLLKLGVTREEGEESRCEAAATLRSYLAEVEELIPSRVRGAFSSLVEGHLERAEETSREPRQLLQKRDVHYAEDRDRHLKVLADLVQLKYKLFASVGQEDSGIEIPSIGVFAELARLDLVPITLSREMATAAAGSVGGMTGEVAQGLMEKLLESAIGRFLDHLFSDGVGQGERRERQFRQMVEDLDRFPSLDPYRGIIDDPQRGYPDVVVRCLQTQPVQFTDEAIRALESLNSRYPEISGVARLLAHGYTATGKKGEAIEILRRAAEKGLSAEGRERCNRQMLELRFQQALDEKDHVGAARLGLTLLAEDDESPGLAQNVIVICSAAAQEGTKGPDRHEVEGAVNAWIHRARANPECPSDGLGEVEGMLENSLLQMTVARAGGSGETRNWSAVLQELEEFENEHPGLANTGYFRMMAHYQLGAAATHDPSEREAALEHFRLAKEDAERLTRDENADQTYREQAKQVLGQLSAVL